MAPFIGEIRLFAFPKVPVGWYPCDGRSLSIAEHQALYSVLGATFGSDAKTWFALPDLAGRVPIGQGQSSETTRYHLGDRGGEETHYLIYPECPIHGHALAVTNAASTSATPGPDLRPGGLVPYPSDRMLYTSATTVQTSVGLVAATLAASGGGQPHDNMMPSVVMNYCIAEQGIYPPDGDPTGQTEDGYLGEIRIVAFPCGADGFKVDVEKWLPCDGRLLPISGNQPLHGLIGTAYGGDGATTFALPNLNGTTGTGSVAISQGRGPGMAERTIGAALGSRTTRLAPQQMPMHTHQFRLGVASTGSAAPGNSGTSVMIDPHTNGFSNAPPNVTLPADTITIAGGGAEHDNQQPTLGLCYAIAITGSYPLFA